MGDGRRLRKKKLDVIVARVQRLSLNEYGRDQIVRALIDLGLRYPRGPSIKNEGTHKKRYFAAHALWEGDGKTLKIRVNGEEFSYCWYAFIDQNTTLLVGSSLTGFESAESFLKALKSGKDTAGFFAMGVLIDNRLTNEDKTAVKEFCVDHGIVLVNTFPGNSKSNGIIEGNFSIFEKQVGEVYVNGKNPEEIAISIARNVIGIFTQQRNHRPRKRLFDQTPAEVAKDAKRPEHQKQLLEKLRDRLLREELEPEAKLRLIAGLMAKFEPMSDKAAYNEEFRAGHKALNEIVTADLKTRDLSQVATKLVAFLAVCANRPGPSHLLMSLENLCFGLLDFVAVHRLPELWRKIEQAIQRSRDISLAKWQIMAEFIIGRLGMFIFPATAPPVFAGAANQAEVRV